ncbi:MAG TPA: site-specific DNA-methyltransferase [Verrucomicrobiae bacterium]|nr:site-specific DNA-methyltransferase [Verrucomicrobiae bacterium]
MKPASTVFRLKTQDCIQAMKELPDESVDIVVTSPPYNLGIQYDHYKDTASREEYLKWTCRWTSEVKRVLKDKGSFFLNVGASPSNPLLPHEVLVALRDGGVGLVLQNTFHWIKSISVQSKDGDSISAGHFKPIQSKRYVNDCHEYVFHLTKHGDTPLERLSIGVPYSDKSNIGRWAHTKGKDARCRGNNWFIPYKTILSRSKERPHPATFPVQLAEYCIRIHGLRPDLVMLDPFLGIGHSALAAKQCGVKEFIGVDIDSGYVQVARKVLEKGFFEGSKAPVPAPGKRRKQVSGAQGDLF